MFFVIWASLALMFDQPWWWAVAVVDVLINYRKIRSLFVDGRRGWKWYRNEIKKH